MICGKWKKEHKASGSNPWVRRCRVSGLGPIQASIILWQPGMYSVAIKARFGRDHFGREMLVEHAYGKTLAAAKAAATRKMEYMARKVS